MQTKKWSLLALAIAATTQMAYAADTDDTKDIGTEARSSTLSSE